VWSTELITAIFADPVANADYHARLRSSESTIAFVNVASPIPIPIIDSAPTTPTVPPVAAPTVAAPTPPAVAPTASVDKGDGDDGLSQAALGGIIGGAVVALGIFGYVVYAATNGKPPTSTAASAPLQSAGGRGGAGSVMDTSILSAAGSQSSLAMRKKLIFTPTAETISMLSVNNPENVATRTAVTTTTAAAMPRVLAKKDAYDDDAVLAVGPTAPTMDSQEPDDEPILDDSYEEKRCVYNEFVVGRCSPSRNSHTGLPRTLLLEYTSVWIP
jgi:hypothetical protein